MIERIEPILTVVDTRASADFYVHMLDFKIDMINDTFAVLSRDGHFLYLSRGKVDGHHATFWIGVDDDVQALHPQFQSKGAKILQSPTNYSWAMVMEIQDPDGHIIRIGSDPRTD